MDAHREHVCGRRHLPDEYERVVHGEADRARCPPNGDLGDVAVLEKYGQQVVEGGDGTVNRINIRAVGAGRLLGLHRL